jgi:hypothetical protein
MPPKHILPSILIVIFLGMQLSTFVTGTRVWPWMGYAMYAYPSYAPIRYRAHRAYVVFEDGEHLDVDHTTMGLGRFAYKDTMLLLMARGDMAVAEQVRQRVESTTGRAVAEVRLEITIYTAQDGQIRQQIEDRAVEPRQGEVTEGNEPSQTPGVASD